MNVLIYDGPGIANLQKPLIKAIKKCLGNCYDVIPVDHNTLNTQPWQESTKLLIMPGGRDLSFLESLEKPGGLKKIDQWVREMNGKYFGICAGSYFACSRIEFEMDRPDYKVLGERPLQFCKATAIGSISKTFMYGSEEGAQAMKLLDPSPSSSNQNDLGYAYVNGGPFFKLDNPNDPNVLTLACYEDGSAAVVDCKVGNGRAILSGPHLEISSDHIRDLIDSFTESTEKIHLESMLPLLFETDSKRLEFLTRIFESLGLQVNKQVSPDDPTLYPIWISSLDSNDSLFIKNRLVSNATSQDEELVTLEDFTGIFILSTENAEFEVIGDGKLPIKFCDSLKTFPEFSIAKFQKYLCSFRYPSIKPVFGSNLLYAQRIGSTQTTIEKNPIFASILPHGTVFLASQQIQGRGRGKNRYGFTWNPSFSYYLKSWISQKGCLQFSLRISHKRASTLLFLQYLFGIAVVEGIKRLSGCESIPIHLKWPNDIYIKTEKNELKKIGGILVTSEYVNNTFGVLIGCGLNVNNHRPSLSLDIFSKKEIEIEMVFASILNTFENLYNEFEGDYRDKRDPFKEFREKYYAYWLHSNQKVVVKHQDGGIDNVIIRGLDKTGFLKGEREHSNDTILLQPDGNSFDMLKGLISFKEKLHLDRPLTQLVLN